jgi:ferredoxin
MRLQAEEVRERQVRAEDATDRLRAVDRRISGIEPMDAERSANEGSESDEARKGEKGEVGVTAVVDREKCVCCGLCVDACSRQAIALNDNLAIDPRRCDGCGSCVEECPNEAISLSEAAVLDPSSSSSGRS